MIITERLLLKSPDELQLEDIRKLDTDPAVMEYITDGKLRSEDQSKIWLKRIIKHYKDYNYGLMPVYTKSKGEFIGWAGIKQLDTSAKIELGYRFINSAWGFGYATEASKALLAYAKDQLSISTMSAVTKPLNRASANVLEKCGFKFIKKAYFYDTELDYYELELDTFNT